MSIAENDDGKNRS